MPDDIQAVTHRTEKQFQRLAEANTCHMTRQSDRGHIFASKLSTPFVTFAVEN